MQVKQLVNCTRVDPFGMVPGHEQEAIQRRIQDCGDRVGCAMPMWFASPSGLHLPKRHSDTFPTGIRGHSDH